MDKMPVALKLERVQDAEWRPYTLHMARCWKVPAGMNKALRTNRGDLSGVRHGQGGHAPPQGGAAQQQGGYGGDPWAEEMM